MASIQTTLSVEYRTRKVCTVLTPGCRPTSCVTPISYMLIFCHWHAGFYFLVYLQVCYVLLCRLTCSQRRSSMMLICCCVEVQTLAGKDAFEPWFRKYLETFRLGNVSSEQFKELFLSDFGHLPAAKEIDWDTWFFGKGMAQPGCCHLSAKEHADRALFRSGTS